MVIDTELKPLLQFNPKMWQPGTLNEDDPDLIIPTRYSRYLVASASLFMVTALVAITYATRYQWREMYPVFCLSIFLFVTSVWHWHRPRFSTMIRRIDYIAVLSNLIYASYVATTLNKEYMMIWFIGIGVCGAIFATNEFCYYIQVMRSVNGSLSTLTHTEHSKAEQEIQHQRQCCILERTQPNSPERECVYIRTVFVHLTCVHVFASALALTLIIGGEETRVTH